MDKKTRLGAANEVLRALRSCFDTEAQFVKVVKDNIGKARTDGDDLFTKDFDQMLLDATKILKGGSDPRVELADSMAAAIAGAKSVISPKLHSQPGGKLVQ